MHTLITVLGWITLTYIVLTALWFTCRPLRDAVSRQFRP